MEWGKINLIKDLIIEIRKIVKEIKKEKNIEIWFI